MPLARLPLFYPILPDSSWIRRLVPLGIRLVQLRLKGVDPALRRSEIRESLAIAREHGAILVVNDYWEDAIAFKAPYVHLGQEDLAHADVAAVRRAGVKLGISTHSLEELETALARAPDYVALGPIYETTLKAMPWKPQGLARIKEWKARIGSLPLVAIGGITLERAPGVFAAGASSIAVVSDVVAGQDPEGRVRQWLAWARSAKRRLED